MFARLAPCAASLVFAACSSASAGSSAHDAGADAPNTTADVGTTVTAIAPPPFADTTGEATALAAYPPGPYGVGIGSVVQNYPLDGYRDPKVQATTLQSIQLADFYNPHARDASYVPPAGGQDDRYFPTSSAYPNAGKLKPTALLVDVASVWCGPCNDEAENILPGRHTLYGPCGGEFLLNLADGPNPGTSATPANLRAWTSEYKLDYPSAIDPAYLILELSEQGVYPQNIVIDTTTMKVAAVLGGEAIQGTCGSAELYECTQASDCQTCTSGFCGDGVTTCETNAQCSSIACTTFPIWATFESLLDKTRAGCTL